MLTAPNLTAISGLRHGFFTRKDGHSTGLYKSLNCGLGSDDDQQTVHKNRATCARALGVSPGHIVTAHQEHTPNAVTVKVPWSTDSAPIADGLTSQTPGLALAVLTADCVPVLFAESNSKVIGVAHAGWKGALNGVIENTIQSMIDLGAEKSSIMAAVGPCIGPRSYQVGPEFADRFIMTDKKNGDYFSLEDEKGCSYFDIGAYVQDRALATGIHSVERLPADTCAQDEMFYSYRRSCLKGEPDYGRQLSGIAWEPD